MASPRLPKRRPSVSSTELHRQQQERVAEIVEVLRDEGFAGVDVDTMIFAYETSGSGHRMIARLEKEAREREVRVRSLYEEQLRAHEQLHRLLGHPHSVFRFLHHWPNGRRGTRTLKVDSTSGEPCDLTKACTASSVEIREHANLCRFLGEWVDRARTLPPPDTRGRVNQFAPELLDKARIVERFIDAGLETTDIALLLLATDAPEAMPFSDEQIRAKAHSISVARSSGKTKKAAGRQKPKRPVR